MEEKLIEKVDEKIKKILDTDITSANLDNLYKLSKIRHMTKEDKESMYGNYEGRRAGYDAYGNDYGNYNGYNYSGYGARGRDMKYRGHEYIDRMSNEYGRYMESRNRYGAGEETDKSYHYMVKALEDFIKVLEEEADTPQQKQQLREALQNSMR
jgi:hypothetical protein